MSGILDDPKRLAEAIEELRSLATESANSASEGLDELSARDILKLVNEQDTTVAEVVAGAIEELSEVVEAAVSAISRGGRLAYIGAGTSGRLGVLDAAECPPTYGVPIDWVVGLIAGGEPALTVAQEGAEDDVEQARRDAEAAGINEKDAVFGITARGRTPWVLELLAYAAEKGAWTGLLTCNPVEKPEQVKTLVTLPVGAEVVTGSTRMKGGLATKMALTMISTATMVRLGRVKGNRMVDLMPNSDKLRARQVRTIMDELGLGLDAAVERLKASGGDLRKALES